MNNWNRPPQPPDPFGGRPDRHTGLPGPEEAGINQTGLPLPPDVRLRGNVPLYAQGPDENFAASGGQRVPPGARGPDREPDDQQDPPSQPGGTEPPRPDRVPAEVSQSDRSNLTYFVPSPEALEAGKDALLELVRDSLPLEQVEGEKGEVRTEYMTAALTDTRRDAKTIVTMDEAGSPVAAMTVRPYVAGGEGNTVWEGADPEFMQRAQAWAEAHDMPLQAGYVQAAVVQRASQGQGIASDLLRIADATYTPAAWVAVTRNPDYALMQGHALVEDYRTFIGDNREITPGSEQKTTVHHVVTEPWLRAYETVPGTTVHASDAVLSGSHADNQPIETADLPGGVRQAFNRLNQIQQEIGADGAAYLMVSIRRELLDDPTADPIIVESDDPEPDESGPGPQGEPLNVPGEVLDPYQKEVDAHLARTHTHLSMGETVTVPTVSGPMEFTNAEGWHTGTPLLFYKVGLFGDQFGPTVVELSNGRQVASLIGLRQDSEPVAGGISGACGDDKVVLDIGSGQAIALHELAQQFPGTYIGVDSGYAESRPINLHGTGVQLTKSNWDTLDGIPDASIDTVLTNLGVFLWTDHPKEAVDAITRVAKPGAILRFLMSDAARSPRDVVKLLANKGWEVTTRDDAAIAIKKTN